MGKLSRYSLYKEIENLGDDRLKEACRINIQLLDGLEEVFLSDGHDPASLGIADSDFLNEVEQKIALIKDISTQSEEGKRLFTKMKGLVEQYKEKGAFDYKSASNLFNKIIGYLANYNSDILEGEKEIQFEGIEKGNLPQVFLSSAYDDRLLSLALFKKLYNDGVYLFVDWMHYPDRGEPDEVKPRLMEAMNESSQLLFLRTPNSELGISGNTYIRPWCTWELGKFSALKPNEIYLYNFYAVEKHKDKIDLYIKLYDMKFFDHIEDGKLVDMA